MTDSYTNDIERQNEQLFCQIKRLEDEIVTLQKQISLQPRNIQKIDITEEVSIPDLSYRNWRSLSAGPSFEPSYMCSSEPTYITRDKGYKVSMTLVLSVAELAELEEKLNRNNWSNYR